MKNLKQVAQNNLVKKDDIIEEIRRGGAESLDLRNVVLAGTDLRGANLSMADLSGADLSGADLSEATLFQANLRGALLVNTKFRDAELTGADLSSSNLENSDFSNSGIGMAIFKEAKLFNANLSYSTLTGADLENADLRCCIMHSTRLRETNLANADLTGADLKNADLSLSRVSGAHFNNVDLRKTRLRMIRDFEKAEWYGADIRDINFAGAYQMRRHILDENYIKEFRESSTISLVIYYIWWITSDCGRSVTRWFLWILLLIALFAGIYSYTNIDYGDYQTWFSPIYFSVVTLTTLGFGDVVPASVAGQAAAIAQVMSGYVMLGGLISIFSNKVARRAE